MFLVLIDEVGFSGQENNAGDLITSKKRLKQINTSHLKYVDDLSLAETVKINSELAPVPSIIMHSPLSLLTSTDPIALPYELQEFENCLRGEGKSAFLLPRNL